MYQKSTYIVAARAAESLIYTYTPYIITRIILYNAGARAGAAFESKDDVNDDDDVYTTRAASIAELDYIL